MTNKLNELETILKNLTIKTGAKMKIYSFKKDLLNGDNLVSILEKEGLFTAITRSESRDFKSLSSAKNWLEKRGYKTILEIEIIK